MPAVRVIPVVVVVAATAVVVTVTVTVVVGDSIPGKTKSKRVVAMDEQGLPTVVWSMRRNGSTTDETRLWSVSFRFSVFRCSLSLVGLSSCRVVMSSVLAPQCVLLSAHLSLAVIRTNRHLSNGVLRTGTIYACSYLIGQAHRSDVCVE